MSVQPSGNRKSKPNRLDSMVTSFCVMAGFFVSGCVYVWWTRKNKRDALYRKLLRMCGTSELEFRKNFNALMNNSGWVNKEEFDRLMSIVKDEKVRAEMWRRKGGTDSPDCKVMLLSNNDDPRTVLRRMFDDHDLTKTGKIEFDQFVKLLQLRAAELECKQLSKAKAEETAVSVLANLGKDKNSAITRSEFCIFFLGENVQPPAFGENVSDEKQSIEIF